MTINPYCLLLIVFLLLGCKSKKNYPEPAGNVDPDSETEILDVTLFGVRNDGKTDNSAVIQGLVGSGKTLYFPKGIYVVEKFINISSTRNLKIFGEQGTVLTTTQNKILTITGSTSNLEISRIKFLSTRKDEKNDTEGLIFIANYGANDVMDGIDINNCIFSNPDTHANGIKLVSEGANAMAKNITITHNRFESIGRFGVEFQNHVTDPMVIRFKDFSISNNYFYDVGTIQSKPAPACVSVSGYSTNGKINGNEMVEMRMQTADHIYYGIENAGTLKLETIGNKMSSAKYGFTGLLSSGPSVEEAKITGQPYMKDWVIRDNIIELSGDADLHKIRGMELGNLENYSITNNTIITDGYAMRLINCRSGKVNNNNCRVSAGNVLYFESGSANNEISGNVLDASKGPDHGVVLFNGVTTTGNSASDNTLIKTGGLPGNYVNWNGARDNF